MEEKARTMRKLGNMGEEKERLHLLHKHVEQWNIIMMQDIEGGLCTFLQFNFLLTVYSS